MRITLLNGIAALTVAAALLSSVPLVLGSPSQASAQVDDHALQQKIQQRFEKSSSLKRQDIKAAVENGVVTLTGVVATNALKARAAQLAQVPGVSRVVNQIEVDPSRNRSKIDTAAEKTKEGMSKGVDATTGAAKKTKEAVKEGIGKSEEGVGKAADKTAEGLSKTGNKMSDVSISTRVKSRIGNDDLLRGSAVDVEVKSQVVTLKGTVTSSAARERAVELAKSVDGVQRVVDELTVVKP